MNQFTANPLDRIVDLLVDTEDWSASTCDEIARILRDSGDVNNCGCGYLKRYDDPICPHHNVTPMEEQ